MGTLLEEIENIEERTIEEETQGFCVTDLKGAAWVFKKIKEKSEEISEIDKVAEAELEELDKKIKLIKEWQEKEKAKLDRDIDYLKHFVFDYYNKKSELNPKFRLSTPYGAVKKNTRKKWNWIDDDNLVVENVKAVGLGNLVETKETVNKTKLKSSLIVTKIGSVATKDGEVLDCVTVETRTILDVTIK